MLCIPGQKIVFFLVLLFDSILFMVYLTDERIEKLLSKKSQIFIESILCYFDGYSFFLLDL